MKHKKLSDALAYISESHIAEASEYRKRRYLPWVSAVAAVLAAVLLLTLPGSVQAKAVSVADYPQYQWESRQNEMEQICGSLYDFFAQSISQTLSGSEGKNQVYSPANLYYALAVSAELTAGSTRQQILDAIGVGDMDTLRQQANTYWNACYYDRKDQTLLANSIWLDEGLDYNQETMDTLAGNYYTSVYQSDLDSPKTAKAITSWLNKQTGNLLKGNTGGPNIPQVPALMAYSTVFYRVKWSMFGEFNPQNNTQDIFHAPSGDRTVTFMHRKEVQTTYYFFEDFGAISLGLRDGGRMWLILPDADKTVEDVLSSSDYAQLVLSVNREQFYGEESEHHKYMKVNLSMPKFDISASSDLREDVEALGIREMFQTTADFSGSVESDLPVWFESINQATRIAVDEEGITAASYIELPGAGAAKPPEEIIDFILDRPFLFVVSNRYEVPLFAGIVNEP